MKTEEVEYYRRFANRLKYLLRKKRRGEFLTKPEINILRRIGK